MNQEKFAALIYAHIQDRLQWLDRVEEETRLSELITTSTGFRIVSSDHGHGLNDYWEYTDAKTGEVLAKGHGIDAYRAAAQPNWYHTDFIEDKSFELVPEPECDPLIPDNLAYYLNEWVDDNPESARKIVESW